MESCRRLRVSPTPCCCEIGNEDVAAAVHGNLPSAQAAAQGSDGGIRRDAAVDCEDLLHRSVPGISDEDVAAGIHRNADGTRVTDTPEAAGQGLDRRAGRDAAVNRENFLYGAIFEIGDEYVPVPVPTATPCGELKPLPIMRRVPAKVTLCADTALGMTESRTPLSRNSGRWKEVVVREDQTRRCSFIRVSLCFVNCWGLSRVPLYHY